MMRLTTQAACGLIGLSVVLCSSPKQAHAQVNADTTLGSENSTIVRDILIRGVLSDRIDGGAQRDNTLFHSLSSLDIASDRGAYFANPAGIQQIITRVTGGGPSQIQGVLGVLGNAHLILINPDGLIFSPTARLDLNGSFLASTASSVNLADGHVFSARNPQPVPLLTVSVPVGLGFGSNPQGISVTGPGNNLSMRNAANQLLDANVRIEPLGSTPAGLAVAPGQTLALVGGNLSLQGANLTAPAGRIELGSILNPATVGLQSTATGFTLDYTGLAADRFGSLQMSQRSAVDVSGNATTSGGGSIQAQVGLMTLTGGSVFANLVRGSSNGGSVLLSSRGVMEFVGTSGDLQLSSGVFMHLAPSSTGNGGNLVLEADRFSVHSGAQVIYTSYGAGKMGDMVLRAREAEIFGRSIPEGIFTRVLSQPRRAATGTAGNVLFEGNLLSIREGGRLFAGTNGSVDSGNIAIRARDVEVIGPTNVDLFTQIIATTEGGTGRGGSVLIQADRVRLLTGGSISVSTFGRGQAGNVMINAPEIEMRGTTSNAASRSGVYARLTTTTATGNGGGINIQTNQLTMADRAVLDVTNQGDGNAGFINIQANSFTMQNNALLTSGTAAAQGGDINIQAQNFLLDLSQINVTAGNARTGAPGVGNGGSVNIEVANLEMRNSSDIAANAVNLGNAGSIRINASERFRLSNQVRLRSDTVSGQGGNIVVNTPLLDIGQRSTISVAANNRGNGGNILLTAGQINSRENSEILANALGTGNGGNIQINTQGLLLDNARIRSEAVLGQGGSITVNTETLALQNSAQIVTGALGTGNAGEVKINATTANLDNQARISSLANAGQAGNLLINTAQLRLNHGSQFAVTASNNGNGGNLIVRNQKDLQILNNSVINASVLGRGNGGVIDIQSQQILLDNQGQINTSADAGRGGNLFLTAPTLTLQNQSRINAISSGVGNGGTIDLKIGNLALFSGSQITVSATGSGNAGNIQMQVDRSLLTHGSSIITNTVLGEGGNIILQGNLLQLRNGSTISATAGGSGNGGNITYNLNDYLLVLEGSKIAANAFRGRGGSVLITTQAIFVSPDSQITASSELGVRGTVSIRTLGLDPQNSLTPVPDSVPILDRIVAGSCLTRQVARRGTFVVAGKGGVTRTPLESSAHSRFALSRLQTITPPSASAITSQPFNALPPEPEPAVPTAARWQIGDPIQEAQQLVTTPEGRVVLVAQATTPPISTVRDLICEPGR